MPARFWAYLLVGALTTAAVLSGLAHAAELRDPQPESPGPGSLLHFVGLASLALALFAGLGVARSLLTARHQLERQAQVLDAAGSMSRDWLWESDLEGRITYSSPSLIDLLGYTPDEVVGRFTDELTFDEAAAETVRQSFRTARHTMSGWDHAMVSWRHQTGERVLLQGAAVPIQDQRGKAVGYRGARRPPPNPASPQAIAERERRLDAIVCQGAVTMALQPLVSLVSGRAVGVEALARFADGRSPEEWFREAGEAGRTVELDALTFSASLALLARLPDHVYLSVNAGPELLLDPGFPGIVTSTGAALDRLVIEITEHARVTDYPVLMSTLESLRGQGVRFAVDDTGAGYSSLNHVLQLRPDIIKLDRGLLTDLAGDPARRSLITALVLLALEMGATVTGEGVEESYQLEALASLGVDYAQGYFLAHPTTDPDQWATWFDREWLSLGDRPLSDAPAAVCETIETRSRGTWRGARRGAGWS